jgi:pimeloyl-ACP methyl ester carboxylesterase
MLGHLTEQERTEYEAPFEDRGGDVPWDTLPPFNAQSMVQVDQWLKSDAVDVLAVYGEYDPWSAGRVTVNPNNGSKVYVAPQASHGAFLQDLAPADLDEVTDRINALAPLMPGSVRVPTRFEPNRTLPLPQVWS